MSNYKPRVRVNDGSFYAYVVRVDNDGQEIVIHGYKGRSFKTLAAGLKSTQNYIKKNNL